MENDNFKMPGVPGDDLPGDDIGDLGLDEVLSKFIDSQKEKKEKRQKLPSLFEDVIVTGDPDAALCKTSIPSPEDISEKPLLKKDFKFHDRDNVLFEDRESSEEYEEGVLGVSKEDILLERMEQILPVAIPKEELSIFEDKADAAQRPRRIHLDVPIELVSPDELVEEEEFVSKARPVGDLIRNRYEIAKIINEKKDRNTYIVLDNKQLRKAFIIKEIIPPSMSDQERKLRNMKYLDSIRIVSTFRHPNLAEVFRGFSENDREYSIMNKAEGIDLEKLTKMNIKPFSEKEVVNWGVELSEAVEFLHFRPVPFTLGDLKPHHIIVNEKGTLKITNYDFQRFYNMNRTLEFLPNDPTKLYEDITSFAKILYFLLTKKHYAGREDKIEWPDSLSTKMKKLLRVACKIDQKTYGNIKKFREALKDTQVEEKAEEHYRKFFGTRFDKIDFSWFWKGITSVLSQNPFLLALEGMLIVFILIIFMAKHAATHYHHPAGKVAYASAIDELLVINPSKYEILKIFPFKDKISLLFLHKLPIESGGRTRIKDVLLVGFEKTENIEVYDPGNMKKIGEFYAAKNPTKIILDSENKALYALHPTEGKISVIGSENLQFQMIIPAGLNPTDIIYVPLSKDDQAKRVRLLLRKARRESLGINPRAPNEGDAPSPTGIPQSQGSPAPDGGKKPSGENGAGETTGAVSIPKPDIMSGADLGGEPGAEVQEEKIPSPTLVVSDTGGRQLIFVDAITGEIKSSFGIEGIPGSLILSRDYRELFVADQGQNAILLYNLSDMKLVKTYRLEGKIPIDMALLYPQNKLWILMKESDSIEILDIYNESFEKINAVGKSPERMALDPDGNFSWISNQGTKDMSIIDVKTRSVVKKMELADKLITAICIEDRR
jgi:DNA-binding beta-propeller fold protein YncE